MRNEKLPKELNNLMNDLSEDFNKLREAHNKIKKKLEKHSDNKQLKGNETVGWLGEIYGKLMLNGTLVLDNKQHDIESEGRTISVKARKKKSDEDSKWTQTSAIPKIEGEDCPTHLMFLLFNYDYSLEKVWLYPWEKIIKRFTEHIVRGEHRSYKFNVSPKRTRTTCIWKIQVRSKQVTIQQVFGL